MFHCGPSAENASYRSLFSIHRPETTMGQLKLLIWIFLCISDLESIEAIRSTWQSIKRHFNKQKKKKGDERCQPSYFSQHLFAISCLQMFKAYCYPKRLKKVAEKHNIGAWQVLPALSASSKIKCILRFLLSAAISPLYPAVVVEGKKITALNRGHRQLQVLEAEAPAGGHSSWRPQSEDSLPAADRAALGSYVSTR